MDQNAEILLANVELVCNQPDAVILDAVQLVLCELPAEHLRHAAGYILSIAGVLQSSDKTARLVEAAQSARARVVN